MSEFASPAHERWFAKTLIPMAICVATVVPTLHILLLEPHIIDMIGILACEIGIVFCILWCTIVARKEIQKFLILKLKGDKNHETRTIPRKTSR